MTKNQPVTRMKIEPGLFLPREESRGQARKLPRGLKTSLKRIIGLLGFAALLVLGSPSPGRLPGPSQNPRVRVKLAVLGKPATISGKPVHWTDARGRVGSFSGAVEISWTSSGLMIQGKKRPAPVKFYSSGSPLSFSGEEFRGEILITADSPPLAVNVVPVEEYVAGVINREIDSRWPAAAVDAQAILARTYALKKAEERKDRPYDLDRTTADQVYGGVAVEDEGAWAAVNRTRGLVLAYQGKLALGHYHSCCGGRTERPSAVWGGRDLPYQVSVVCPYCRNAPRYFWRFPEQGALSPSALARMLGIPGLVQDVEVVARTESGRAARVRIRTGGKVEEMTGPEFRSRMGLDKIWSTAFQVDKEKGGFVFRGSGSGHGAGMCQWGARTMALAGLPRSRILKFYFPGTEIRSYSSL